jgi:hypothetical protein
MTKERVALSWKVVAGQKSVFITFRAPEAHDSCGFLLVLTRTQKPSSTKSRAARLTAEAMPFVQKIFLGRNKNGANTTEH